MTNIFRKLSFRTFASIMLSILATAMLMGYFSIGTQTKILQDEYRKNTEETAIGIAKMLKNYIHLKDYASIEDTFSAIVENKKIISISLINDKNISVLCTTQKGTAYDSKKYQISTQTTIFADKNSIESFAPVGSGWHARLEVSTSEIDKLSAGVMRNSLLVALFACLFAIFLNIFIMRKPILELEGIADFAQELPTHFGLDAPEAHSTTELANLSSNLTAASHKLYDQNRALEESNHELGELNTVLEDRVKEQTDKAIEHERLLVQQSKMAAMGDMMGAIAHQWRQPLNALAITIQDIGLANDYNELTDDYIKSSILRCMNSIRFMSKTIDDFRDFFKPNKEMVNFEIKTVIDSTLSIVSAQLKSAGVKLEVSGDDFTTFGYPSEMSQVILNLISNAKDAVLDTKQRNGDEYEGCIWINTRKNGNEGTVAVSDNGGGVPVHVIERVYEPYFTTKEQGKGTGIGLYMSKTIIDNHMNGRIEVVNNDIGAVFSIILPIATPDA
jgi:C4-dicarboxylate-specific signal transduction histidine kinase